MTTRRKFLKCAGAALAAPLVLPARVVFGANAPSNRITTAHIGVGGQGGGLLGGFLGLDNCQVLAVCDPFKDRREAGAADVDNRVRHERLQGVQRFPRSPGARPTSTPSWSPRPTTGTCRSRWRRSAPARTSIARSRWASASSRTGPCGPRSTSTGRSSSTARSSAPSARTAASPANWSATATSVKSRRSTSSPRTVPAAATRRRSPCRTGLDYDLWLGPAPVAPYAHDRVIGGGRWYIYDYALGFIAGWGAHPLDIAHWGYPQIPVEYDGTGVIPTEGLFDTVVDWDVTGRYASGAEFTLKAGSDLTTFIGTEGWIQAGRGRQTLAAEPASLLQREDQARADPSAAGQQPLRELHQRLPRPQDAGQRHRFRRPIGFHEPPRRHRDPHRPQDSVGPGPGNDSRRRASPPA